MAWAWRSDNLKRSCNVSIATLSVSDSRIIEIISSIWSSAILKPSKICARSFAFFKLYSVRRRTTVFWCSKYSTSASFKLINLGRPFTRAIIFTPNDVCNGVCLYKLFKITFALASLRTSITTLTPVRKLVSSRRSVIPSILFSRANSAIFSIILALFTWYGISVTTIRWRPPPRSSIDARARIWIDPRPVS